MINDRRGRNFRRRRPSLLQTILGLDSRKVICVLIIFFFVFLLSFTCSKLMIAYSSEKVAFSNINSLDSFSDEYDSYFTTASNDDNYINSSSLENGSNSAVANDATENTEVDNIYNFAVADSSNNSVVVNNTTNSSSADNSTNSSVVNNSINTASIDNTTNSAVVNSSTNTASADNSTNSSVENNSTNTDSIDNTTNSAVVNSSTNTASLDNSTNSAGTNDNSAVDNSDISSGVDVSSSLDSHFSFNLYSIGDSAFNDSAYLNRYISSSGVFNFSNVLCDVGEYTSSPDTLTKNFEAFASSSGEFYNSLYYAVSFISSFVF